MKRKFSQTLDYVAFSGMQMCFHLMANRIVVTDHTSHFVIHQKAQFGTCSGIWGIDFHMLAFSLALFLFFYPCFTFVLSLYLFLSHYIVCILVNYLKSLFGIQRSKKINQ